MRKGSPSNHQARQGVLLLGWGGSKPRSMAKVSEFYSNRGLPSITYIMPLGIPHAIRLSLLRPIIFELQGLKEQGIESICIHSFSNNGAWSYASLIDMIEREDLLHTIPKLEKIVFDSGPQLFYEDIGILEEVRVFGRVLTSVVLGRAQYHHTWVTPLLQSLLYPTCFLKRIVNRLQQILPANLHIVPPYLEMNCYLRDKSPTIPILFMYSKDDGLIPYDSIVAYKTELVNRYCKNGLNGEELVREHMFSGVGHTAPFFSKITREEYQKVLCQFLMLPLSIDEKERDTDVKN